MYFCEHCGKEYKSQTRLRRHEQRCDGINDTMSVSTVSSRQTNQDTQRQYYENIIQTLQQNVEQAQRIAQRVEQEKSDEINALNVKLRNIKASYTQDFEELENANRELKKTVRNLTNQQALQTTDNISFMKKQIQQLQAEKEIQQKKHAQEIEERQRELHIAKQHHTVELNKEKKELEEKYEKRILNLKEGYEKQVFETREQIDQQTKIVMDKASRDKAEAVQVVREELEKLKAEYQSELKQEKLVNQKEISQQKKQLETLERDLTAARRENEIMKRNYRQASSVNTSLQETHQSQLKQIETNAQNASKRYNQELHRLTQAIQEKTLLFDNQTKQMNQIKEELETMRERYRLDNSKADSRYNKLISEYRKHQDSAYKREKDIDDAYVSKINDLESRIQDVQKKNLELQSYQNAFNDQVKTNKDLKKQVDEINQKLRTTLKQNTKIKQQASEFQEKIEAFNKEQDETNHRLNSITKQYNAQKEECLVISGKYEKALARQSELETKAFHLEKHNQRLLASIQEEVQNEKKYSDMLKQDIEKLKLENAQGEETRKELSELKDDYRNLRNRFRRNDNEFVNLQNKFKESEDLQAAAVLQLETTQEELKDVQSKTKTLSLKLQNVRSENVSLTDKLKEVELDRASARKQYTQILNERNEMSQSFIQQRDKIIELETNLTRVIADRDQFRNRFGELKGINDHLGKNLSKVNEDLKSLREDHKKLIEQTSKLVRDKIDLQQKNATEVARFQSAIETLKTERETRESKIRNLLKRVGDYDSLTVEVESLREKVNTFKLQQYELEQSNSELKKLLVDKEAKHREVFSTTLQENESLKTENRQHLQFIEHLKEIDNKHTTLKKEYDILLRENRTLTEFRDKTERLQKEMVEKNKDLQRAKVDLDKLQEKNKLFNTQLSEYKQYESKYKNLQIEMDKNIKQLNDIRIQKEKLENLVASERKAVLNTQSEVDKCQSKIVELNETIVNLRKCIAKRETSLIKKLTQTEQELAEKKSELAYASGQLSTIVDNEKQLETAKIEINKLHNKIVKQTSIEEELQKRNKSLREEIESIRNSNLEKSKKISQFETTNKHLSDRYDNLNSATQQIIKRHEATNQNLNDTLQDLKKYKTDTEKKLRLFRGMEVDIENHKSKLKENEIHIQSLRKINTNLSEQYKDLLNNYNTAKNEYRDYLVVQKEYSDLIIKHNKIKQENDRLFSENKLLQANMNEDLVKKYEKLEEQYANALRHQQDLEKQAKTNHYLKKQLNETSAKLFQIEKDYKHKLNELKEITNNYANLKSKLNAAPSAHSIQKIQEHRDILIKEKAQLQEDYKKASKQVQNLPRLERQVEENKQNFTKTYEKLQKSIEENHALKDQDVIHRKELTSLREELERLQKSVERLTKETETKQSSIDQFNQRIKKMDHKSKRQRDDSLTTIHKYIQQVKDAGIKMERHQKEIEKLKTEIQIVINEREQAKEDLEQVMTMKDELKEYYVSHLNDQKAVKDSQMEELKNLITLRDKRVVELEGMLSKFVSKQID